MINMRPSPATIQALRSRASAGAKEFKDEQLPYLTALIKFGAVIHVIREYIGEITMCVGPSMLPTINQEGDVVVLDKMTARSGQIQVGDVVVASSPRDPNGHICKRVRALGGDTVTQAPRAWYADEVEVVIPRGYVWLEGDNKNNSTDSRSYGAIPEAMIQGRVWLKLWPLTQFGRVSREVPAAAAPVPSEAEDEE
eukprot:TRINITY_DN31677_c0_g1_i1.p1 TRINITY_DN31677_c0_g1~~TRINITY_DN31677_c0_g1_i1.p1  ORF type:complete len:196 (+),score=51.66 TRINITY_DN31677_c0_g1_i1:120-707(+)